MTRVSTVVSWKHSSLLLEERATFIATFFRGRAYAYNIDTPRLSDNRSRLLYDIYRNIPRFVGCSSLFSIFFFFFFFFLSFSFTSHWCHRVERSAVCRFFTNLSLFFRVFTLPFRFRSFSTFRGTSLVSTRFFSSGDKREGGEEQGTHGRKSSEERKRGGAERERVTRILLPRSMFRNTRAFIHEHATTETSHSPSLSAPGCVTETRVVGLSPARFNGVINGRYRGG